MSVTQVLTGSYSDDDTVARIYALLASWRPAWRADAFCRGKDPTRGTQWTGHVSATR
jgi:hypothetical protein